MKKSVVMVMLLIMGILCGPVPREEAGAGEWKLLVIDDAKWDEGTLDSWGLEIQ